MAFVADELAGHWATPDSILVPGFMPSLVADAEFRRWATSYERACASPGAIRDLMRFVATVDVRSILSTIRVPTLVVHRTDDLIVSVEHGRYLAEHIPGARYVELPGIDHCPWVGDGDSVLDEIEEFLTTFDSPSRAVRAGLAMVDAAAALGIEIRAGLHTGEIERRGRTSQASRYTSQHG